MSESTTSFEARVAFRPRSLDETYDLALAYIRVFARELRAILVVALLVSAVPGALVWLLTDAADGVIFGIVFVCTGLAERSVTAYAGRHLFGNPATVRGAWGATLRKLPFGIVSVLFAGMPVLMIVGSDFDEGWMVGGIMLGFFWPFLLASHGHLSEVSALEQLRIGRAATRARALVAYRFGRALGLLASGTMVRSLFVLGSYSAATFLFSLVLQFKGVSDNFGPTFLILGYALSGPYMALVRFFDYIDARTRREGWDIQVRFNAIAQRERRDRESRLAA